MLIISFSKNIIFFSFVLVLFKIKHLPCIIIYSLLIYLKKVKFRTLMFRNSCKSQVATLVFDHPASDLFINR